MWQDSDPVVSSVLQRSRSSYKHELLLENAAGIPIFQQHGSNDDNVPVYHSRLMHELLGRTQWPSQYNELPGEGHWFKGIMTTSSLLDFYEERAISQYRPTIPLSFIISIPSSGAMGSVYGIYVDQLQSPDMNGKIEVTRDLRNGVWYLQTQNIHRFHLSVSTRVESPIALVLDRMEHPFIVDAGLFEKTWYLKDPLNRWITSNDTEWKNIYQRHGRQMGAMDAILRSNGTFTISTCSAGAEHIALQISRNLLQYFAADSLISEKCSSTAPFLNQTFRGRHGNLIVLAVGDDLPPSRNPAFPIHVCHGTLVLSNACNYSHSTYEAGIEPEKAQKYVSEYTFQKGLGALFLRPLENERLELIVWGADLYGLEQAARLVPTLTGVGQPDFIVLSDSCRWKGHGGLFAAGHFNKFWQISSGSFHHRGPGTYGKCLL